MVLSPFPSVSVEPIGVPFALWSRRLVGPERNRSVGRDITRRQSKEGWDREGCTSSFFQVLKKKGGRYEFNKTIFIRKKVSSYPGGVPGRQMTY